MYVKFPKTTIRFNAKLEKSGSSTILTLPKSIASEGGIEGVINAMPFQGEVLKTKDGYGIMLNKVLQDAAEKGEGIRVEITRVGDEDIRVPADLYKAIAGNTKALETWNVVTELAKRDWIFWFISCKQEETRLRHIAKALDQLSHGKRRVCCFGGITWLMKTHSSKKTKNNK